MVLKQQEENVNIALTRTTDTEKILGYSCTKYLITSADGKTQQGEVWVTSIEGLNPAQLSQYRSSDLQISYFDKLNGIPLRSKVRFGTARFIIEATGIQVRKFEPSVFEVPAGYKKVDAMF
jgi:hypothetical protein